ncbi:hypothetical protein [Paenibacillus polymyxa]|uniref:hypothetical protein n=1 Tax=Paenibacillus polymyxa TaxID=1406 RepID=UPI001117D0AE|nr:hypothetical protein [Paenibacillus polymyxa]QDA30243.1 hypothetical protein FGY93_25335 [Paenibacillus polymyxa]
MLPELLIEQLGIEAIEECEQENVHTYARFNATIMQIEQKHPELKSDLLALEDCFMEIGSIGVDLYEKGFKAAGQIIDEKREIDINFI